MSFRVSVISSEPYLHLRVEGESSADTVVGYLDQARKMCSERGLDAVLIERRLTGPSLEPAEIYELTAQTIKEWWPLPRLALVDIAPAANDSYMEFVETVAVNRGLRMRFCRNLEEARSWLEESTGDNQPT